jgi:hypothetical protein
VAVKPIIPEAEAGGLQIQGQPMLHSKTLPQRTQKEKEKGSRKVI